MDGLKELGMEMLVATAWTLCPATTWRICLMDHTARPETVDRFLKAMKAVL